MATCRSYLSMQESLYFAAVAVLCHLLLGAAVFLTNPRRSINRGFLLLAVIIGCWVAGIEAVFVAREARSV